MPNWNGTDPNAPAAAAQAAAIAAAASDATTQANAAQAAAIVAARGTGEGQYKAGWWTALRASSVGTGVPTVNEMHLSKIFVPVACSVDRIACEVTATASGAAVRLGIYSVDSGNMPSALVLDAGMVDAASSTGIKTITINQALTAGTYYLAAVCQGGTPTMRLTTGGMNATMADTTLTITVPASYPGYTATGTISGALPSTVTLNYSALPMRVAVRYA